MKKITVTIIAVIMLITLCACSDSSVVSENIKKDAEQFKVIRRVVFINNITGEYILEAQGNCSIESNVGKMRLELICKTGQDEYKMHYFGLSDNTSYLVEQLEWTEQNKYHYTVVFKPEAIIPIIERA